MREPSELDDVNRDPTPQVGRQGATLADLSTRVSSIGTSVATLSQRVADMDGHHLDDLGELEGLVRQALTDLAALAERVQRLEIQVANRGSSAVVIED